MNNLPGAISRPDHGAPCDQHAERVAIVRVQGETDSFGCEHIHMCEQCKAAYDAHRECLGGANHTGPCGRCGQDLPLFPVRDWEEGSSGPVYYRCAPCKREFIHLRDADLGDLVDD